MFQPHSNHPPRLSKDPALEQTKKFHLTSIRLKFDRDDELFSFLQVSSWKVVEMGDLNDHFMRRALRSRSVPSSDQKLAGCAMEGGGMLGAS
jgi:hypothetical protein